jgi:DNA-binding LacI/PurR family transcriptional regulator
MGSIAAVMLLERLGSETKNGFPPVLSVEPTIIVRQSTAPVLKT